MADWFKFYENDLSEERLRWAMSEQQQVGIVYVTILSRCCRDKTDTLPWHGEDFELFALAQQCFISPPIANQCLGLLVKIGYVEMGEGFFRVVRWSERQSEYCKKKQKVVPTVSGHSPDSVCLEERRSEEIRKEEKIITHSLLAQKLNNWFKRRSTTPWSPKELKALREIEAQKHPEEDIALLETYYTSGYQYIRRDIQTLLNNWASEIDRARKWKTTPQTNGLVVPLHAQVKAIEEQIRLHVANPNGPKFFSGCTQADKDTLKALRERKAQLTAQLAQG